MPLSDLLARVLARPARRIVDGPVRSLVEEALQGRDVPSPTELANLRAELSDRQRQVQGLEARLDALGALVDELESDLADARRAARDVRPPAPPPAVGLTCPVAGCSQSAEVGFCAAHQDAWDAGALVDVVGPDGQVVHGDRVLRVQHALAGKPVIVTGQKRLTVKVDGRRVSFRAAASPPSEAPR